MTENTPTVSPAVSFDLVADSVTVEGQGLSLTFPIAGRHILDAEKVALDTFLATLAFLADVDPMEALGCYDDPQQPHDPIWSL